MLESFKLMSVASILADSPILTLFIVIGLGYLLGELNFFGFRLGVAGVLFMGLAVASAVLTPSVDWFTMTALTVALYILYEACIWLTRLMRR